MKNKKRTMGIIILAAVIGFFFASCAEPSSGGGGTANFVTYSGNIEGEQYTLTVSGPARASYAPQQGDSYILKKGNLTNSGTVQTSGSTLTLKPNSSTHTFTISIQGNNISAITGNITLTWSDNSTTIFGTGSSGTGNPGIGTYSDSVTYSGNIEGEQYTLTVSGPARASYAPQQGDGYVLKKGNLTNSGTIQAASSTLILKPNGSAPVFSISITNNNITAISGIITWSNTTTTTHGNGTTVNTPQNPPNPVNENIPDFQWLSTRIINYNVSDGTAGLVNNETVNSYNIIKFITWDNFEYEIFSTIIDYSIPTTVSYYGNNPNLGPFLTTTTTASSSSGSWHNIKVGIFGDARQTTSIYERKLNSIITSDIIYENPSSHQYNSSTHTKTEYEISVLLTSFNNSSGFLLGNNQKYNSKTTKTVNDGEPVISYSYNDSESSHELINDVNGVKTYKIHYTPDSGNYTSLITYDTISLRGISTSRMLEQKSYRVDSGMLNSTLTYIYPDDPVIREKLPVFSLYNREDASTPSNNEYESYEILNNSASILEIRVKTYTNGILTYQSDTCYEKIFFR